MAKSGIISVQIANLEYVLDVIGGCERITHQDGMDDTFNIRTKYEKCLWLKVTGVLFLQFRPTQIITWGLYL